MGDKAIELSRRNVDIRGGLTGPLVIVKSNLLIVHNSLLVDQAMSGETDATFKTIPSAGDAV